MGTYPVYSESGVRLSTLNIDLKLGRVVGYSRSLLQRGEMIESYTHELPSGAEVMDALKENGINLSQIRLFNLGYKQTVEGSLLKYEPCWVIELMDGKRWLIPMSPIWGGMQRELGQHQMDADCHVFGAQPFFRLSIVAKNERPS